MEWGSGLRPHFGRHPWDWGSREGEGQDTGASQLSCYSSSNEGVETRARIRPGMTGSMWKLTRMEWGSGLRPHSGRCV
jgi:hypothetical protein